MLATGRLVRSRALSLILMFLLLVFLFLLVPVVELFVIIEVARGIGVLETIGLLLFVSVVGAALVRHEGLGVLRKMQMEVAQMRAPTKQLVDGTLILFAGALMLTPGFFTDAIGVVLLIPPTRALFRNALMRWFKGRRQVVPPFKGAGRSNAVVDVDSEERTQESKQNVDLERNQDSKKPPPSLSS